MGEYWWQSGGSTRGSSQRKQSAPPKGVPHFQLQAPEPVEDVAEIYRVGDPCPNCGFARLEYDGYFNVYCSICGFRTGARGACT